MQKLYSCLQRASGVHSTLAGTVGAAARFTILAWVGIGSNAVTILGGPYQGGTAKL